MTRLRTVLFPRRLLSPRCELVREVSPVLLCEIIDYYDFLVAVGYPWYIAVNKTWSEFKGVLRMYRVKKDELIRLIGEYRRFKVNYFLKTGKVPSTEKFVKQTLTAFNSFKVFGKR